MTGSYRRSMFTFLRNHQTFPQSVGTILYSHQKSHERSNFSFLPAFGVAIISIQKLYQLNIMQYIK